MDQDDPNEERGWSQFVDQNQQRDRQHIIGRGDKDEDEVEDKDDGVDYTLKDTDMLWEIGCRVRYYTL